MKSTPFISGQDIAPIPFDQRLCELAKNLKTRGLEWQPQVGCFVWDPQGAIAVPSPFPYQIYFVLNLNHFLKIFGSEDKMIEKLVWLPTWYQAREICHKLGIPDSKIFETLTQSNGWSSRRELGLIYQLISDKLRGE